MTYSIEISNQAEQDLVSIYEYIAFELSAPAYAAAQYARIKSSILELDIMPERFQRYDAEPWFSRNLRVMPVDNYCVFYIPSEKLRLVTILRIMFYSQDFDSQLLTYPQ